MPDIKIGDDTLNEVNIVNFASASNPSNTVSYVSIYDPETEHRVSAITAWNQDVLAGSVTPAITLPTPSGKCESITYIFTAASANASFTAPANWILCKDEGTSGLSTGNTISFTALTVGNIYEVSFKPVSSSVIRMLMCETKTA